MVPHGTALTLWDSLDPEGPSRVEWIRPVPAGDVVLLLGAFDPPTRAHVAIAAAASRSERAPAACVMTKTLLDRPPDRLLTPHERLELLDRVCEANGYGLAGANRGTYLDVGRALHERGFSPTFVVGSDKLKQLQDPSFYTDGERGVEATFSELRFLVVPRGGAPIDRADVRILDVEDVFSDLELSAISSTEIRRRIRAGEEYGSLVPPEVARGLGGYTAAR